MIMTEERKMVTLRKVKEVLPIEGADKIEIVRIDGWQLVSGKGNFKAGDWALFHEIDSFVEKASSLKNMIFSTAVELGRLMRAGDRSELQSFIDKLKPNKAAKLPTADSIFRSPEAVARDAQYMLHTGIVTQANITATGCPSAYMSSGVSILQPRPGESVGAFQLRIAKENMAIKKEKTILWSKKLGRQFVVEYKFVKPEDARVSCKGCDGTGLELGPCRICKECTIDWLEKNELHTRRN
jgi:hypothetical protein